MGSNGPRSTGIQLEATVGDACDHQGWKLRTPRSDQALVLHTYLTTITNPAFVSEEDCIDWYVNEIDCKGFSTSKTWEALRPSAEKKDWFDVVWYKGAVPKHAFMMWVVNINRLPTRARLHAWGVASSPDCCLCTAATETREHLFLHCNSSAQLWGLVFARLSPSQQVFTNWAELLAWIRHDHRREPTIMRKLATQTCLYNIWKQRNNALHNNTSLSSQATFKIMDQEIKNTINSRRQKKHWRDLMHLWIR